MSAASAGVISAPTAKTARNNFLMADTLPVGNGERMRLLAVSGGPMVTLTEKREGCAGFSVVMAQVIPASSWRGFGRAPSGDGASKAVPTAPVLSEPAVTCEFAYTLSRCV